MNLNELEARVWKRLNADIEAWYEKMNTSAPAQIAFQRSNPVFAEWIDAELVPSMLCGEAAASHCLESIASELEDALRHTKFLAAYAAWETLNAPPNDVATDFINQGWTPERLSAYLKNSMLDSQEATNIFDSKSSGPSH